MLTIDGDGVWVNNPPAGNTTIGEIRFKGAGPVGSVYFKRLVMNGGQLDQAGGSMVAIEGEMDILANTPLYNDSSSDHGFRIDAWLTGSGTIEFHAYSQNGFQPGYVYNLNITGTSNTFSGQWNVVVGVLLGSAPGSLGTNNITVGANGALETSYDIWNPLGSLVLDGQMFLHQNDLFKSVTVSNVVLVPGTYSFADLSTAYPSHFPAVWTQQAGSSFSTGSGSITVLGNAPPPVSLHVQPSGSSLQLSWPQGTLLEATNVLGPWTTNTHGSPFTVTPAEPQKFYRVRVQ